METRVFDVWFAADRLSVANQTLCIYSTPRKMEIVLGMAAGLFMIVVIDIIYFLVLFVSISLHKVLVFYKGNECKISVCHFEVYLRHKTI